MLLMTAILEILIVARLTCEAASSYSSRLVNRRQHKLIESSMDLEADPCEDFYQYSCGKWSESVDDAGDKFFETLTMIDYHSNRELARYMNRISLRNKPKFVRKAYEYYKSCVDIEQYQSLEYLRWMKNNEHMKWPTLWSAHKTNVEFDWVHFLGVLRRYGLNGILIEEIMLQKKDDPKKLVIDLDKPVEGGGFVSLTYENLKVLIETLAVPMNTRTFEKLWSEIRDFEELLVKLDDIEDEEGNKLITVQELPLAWQRKYLSVVLNQTNIDDNMELYIQNIPYMEALDALLKQYENRFICKYLEVRFLWHLHLKGPANFIPTDCLSSTRSLLPLVMYWIYESIHPELTTKICDIEKLFDNVMNHFNQTLHHNKNDFNETILDYLITKLNNIQLKVGNLPRINTIDVLEKHFKDLQLNVSDFYGNHLNLLHFNFKAMHAGIENTLTTNAKEYFHLEHYETGSSSSPYFIQRSNIVIVPPTVLQPPVYHSEYEDIYKYSSIGFLLAHEILHSFDYTGLEVDVNGKLNTEQYENILANPIFEENYSCLRDLNPIVIDEKIADVSGLRYAYETFFALHPEAVIKTRHIYGTEMSLRKLFFLNFAQFFCGSSSSDDFINTSEHGLDSDRVNDALSHFPEFKKAFGCSRHSRMIPNETCHLWR